MRGFIGAEYRRASGVEDGLGWLETMRSAADELSKPWPEFAEIGGPGLELNEACSALHHRWVAAPPPGQLRHP